MATEHERINNSTRPVCGLLGTEQTHLFLLISLYDLILGVFCVGVADNSGTPEHTGLIGGCERE